MSSGWRQFTYITIFYNFKYLNSPARYHCMPISCQPNNLLIRLFLMTDNINCCFQLEADIDGYKFFEKPAFTSYYIKISNIFG